MIVSLTPGQVCERGSLFHILRKAHGESHRQFDDRMKQMLEKTYVGCGVVAYCSGVAGFVQVCPSSWGERIRDALELVSRKVILLVS